MTPTAGLGFKTQHSETAVAATVEGLWFEVHPENYMVQGGPRLAMLEALRATHPLSLHGVVFPWCPRRVPIRTIFAD